MIKGHNRRKEDRHRPPVRPPRSWYRRWCEKIPQCLRHRKAADDRIQPLQGVDRSSQLLCTPQSFGSRHLWFIGTWETDLSDEVGSSTQQRSICCNTRQKWAVFTA